jgi:hypothetical protein
MKKEIGNQYQRNPYGHLMFDIFLSHINRFPIQILPYVKDLFKKRAFPFNQHIYIDPQTGRSFYSLDTFNRFNKYGEQVLARVESKGVS